MNLILDVIQYIPRKLLSLFYFILDWFLGINLFEKLVVCNGLTAFFAVILPSAKYYIFESWFTVNNPMSVYMIVVAFYMFLSIFFHSKFRVISRVLLLIYFIGWTLYHHYADPFVKCEHILMTGYYLNYITAAAYLAASLLSFTIENR
ncbi:MAG: hypothetical protein JW982_02940 [Spirochaetes bacterium]|nr:hypothetical protein [Spirochaetota bacterium]